MPSVDYHETQPAPAAAAADDDDDDDEVAQSMSRRHLLHVVLCLLYRAKNLDRIQDDRKKEK